MRLRAKRKVYIERCYSGIEVKIVKIVVSHVVNKNIVKALKNTIEIDDTEIVYADNLAIYDYEKVGWMNETRERMKKRLEKELKGEDGVYFLAVGFIPAVLIAYGVLREMGKKITVLTYNKGEKMYDIIEWR